MKEFLFLFLGLGFFLFVMHYVIHSQRTDEREQRALERERWERRISEAREFGFGGPNQHTAQTLKDK